MSKRGRVNGDLSPLEEEVMDVIWRLGTARADQVREAMHAKHALTDSTIRTLLRRMEAKGFLEHTTEGRTFIYRTSVKPSDMANQAVQQVIDRFCEGSLSSLLIGMAGDHLISADELRELAAEIERAEKKSKRAN
ncbi:BlaI/MecI/CopY family transcriptional regulator [Schlesneria paludicola]|uniref:BlaI/MecI/CopY family transcriptional regulator n=1 Tax=Schlesneria paludicola TaxID=360056 RepID=UPI00058F1749|nr:BlaI/MecI/CopY family transcriptional regulator [Schlesneria paludicola]